MICRRYSLKPSDVAKDHIEDYQFNLLVAYNGISLESKKAGNKRG
jgi:hypothetical protein